MLATKKLTDRIKVEIKVQKGLLGYPGSPSQYYIAVVGSGPQLGHDNPGIAPRCTRISNNVWMKEIWVKKESWVNFNFLIVHGPTNTVFETEQVSPRRIFVTDETIQYQARFNEEDSKNERDTARKSEQFAEKNNEEGLLKQKVQTTEKDLRAKESKNSAGESNIAKRDTTMNEYSKTLDENLPAVVEINEESNDTVGNMDIDRKWKRAINDMGQKINFEKLLVDQGDMIKVQLGVHKSVLNTYKCCVKAADVYAERIGLKSATQSHINTSGDISHQQLWVRKDLLERFLTGKNNGKFKLKTHEIDLQKATGSTLTEVHTLKQPAAEIISQKTEDKSLSQAISELKVNQRHLKSIAKASRPGSSREIQLTVNKEPPQSCSMISYEDIHTKTDVVRYGLDDTSRPISTDFPDRAIKEAFSAALLDSTHALPNELLQRECKIVKEIPLEFNKTTQLETSTRLKTKCTSTNTLKDNNRGENTSNYVETQAQKRKSPSTWTLMSCKKSLVLAAVGLGLATCLKAFVCR